MRERHSVERDVFEERFEAAVHDYVEGAPTEIDAAALTRSLAANVPRHRLVPAPVWGWRPGSRALMAAVLLVALGVGIVGLGEWRQVGSLLPQQPTPTTSPTAQQLAVTITSPMTVTAPARPNSGTFEAAGQAADASAICRRGTVTDLSVVDTSALQAGHDLDFPLRKVFTCDDGTGTFTMELEIHVDGRTGVETFTWAVDGGTGRYTRLEGRGGGTTGSVVGGRAVNTYSGSVSA